MLANSKVRAAHEAAAPERLLEHERQPQEDAVGHGRVEEVEEAEHQQLGVQQVLEAGCVPDALVTRTIGEGWMSDLESRIARLEPFAAVEALIRGLYPLVHEHLEFEKVTDFGLLYRWAGAQPG